MSLMTGFVVGRDEAQLLRRAEAILDWLGRGEEEVEEALAQLRESWLVGTPDEIAERVAEYSAAGVTHVMLQHHLHEDDHALELMAERLLPG